ncbi:AAA-domain-containing protein [Ophiobolus disseminans]|uniref:AAA-domain-containing protein n=1 Tax=Ophiobolus disseminans TaxID=1469910 RepID=A0A6A7A968_9PLEO|nr:AAA-domain-containing protein [Ophiobolus disseminans]
MYVIRPALRASTARPPARFIRGRRYPSTPRFRGLHTTRALAQAANPPPAPDSTPIGENDAGKPDGEKAAADEHGDAAVAKDDPELLAQKLQRSRETSRRYSAALRRQQRSKKSEGLPPVHIPDWFLKSRVIRHEDGAESTEHRSRPAALSVTVSHEDSGEQATCSVPASRDLDAAQVLSRLVRGLWGRRLDDHEKRKVENYLDERIALVENKASAKDSESSQDNVADTTTSPSSTTDGPAPSSDVQSGTSMEQTVHDLSTQTPHVDETSGLSAREAAKVKKLARKLEDIMTDPNLTSEQRLQQSIIHSTKFNKWMKKMTAAKARRALMSRRLSPLVHAEIRATIAASLSTLRPSASDSFPSAKTNVTLHSPVAEHENLVDACIYEIAEELGSDVITLKAQDLAQLGGDYLGEVAEPTPRSIRSLGYETYRLSAELPTVIDEIVGAAEEEPEHGQPPSMEQPNPFAIRAISLPLSAYKALRESMKGMQFAGVRAAQYDANTNTANEDTSRTQSQPEVQLEDLKLATLLESLLDASEVKQARGLVGTEDATSSSRNSTLSATSSKSPAFFDYSVGSEGTKLELNSALPASAGAGISMSANIGSTSQSSQVPKKSKIIYVKDFKELNATHYGGRIIQKLEEVVRKRRVAGESIMIVGSTCSRELTPELSASGVRGLQGEGESSFFRTIVVEAESDSNQSSLDEVIAHTRDHFRRSAELSPVEKSKIRSINISHLRDMLKSLDPVAASDITDMEQGSELFRTWVSIFPESYLKRVLTYDEVHRIALTALGLHITSPASNSADTEGPIPQMSWAHVALAMGLLKASDTVKYASFDAAAEPRRSLNSERLEGEASAELKTKRKQDEKRLQRQRELHQIGVTATKHEKRLMPGIADPDQIKTTFDQVHVPIETIDSIRTITSLSLLRPDAFNYGILATEKISGALLYGPPGTGKTLLAKAVAKESGSTVLEVSGSQIMDKYVGEGEKNVAAIFSLARKLSPCIVFLDEADAVFASRDAMRDRSSHRDILNQFLKEWDGLNDLSVFVMVATNRPFDLDDAVIRRLPRRLLVDLPTQADRKEILRIHLSGEQLDDAVKLEDLAKRTPFYSGSDLKNIAVSAALACVKEENENAAREVAKTTLEIEAPPSESDSPSVSTAESPTTSSTSSTSPTPPKALHLVRGQAYNFPEKRILHARHFDKALQEISASISEDMTSLTAIKKFDEQYGDRKGNKRKKDFGFGALTERNENAARVRA